MTELLEMLKGEAQRKGRLFLICEVVIASGEAGFPGFAMAFF